MIRWRSALALYRLMRAAGRSRPETLAAVRWSWGMLGAVDRGSWAYATAVVCGFVSSALWISVLA